MVVAISFPPLDRLDDPYPGNFIGQQVRALAERVERITVVCPVPRMPHIASRLRRFANKALLPQRYDLVPDHCEVLFPRYLKAPGDLLMSWTKAQWCRIVNQTVAQFANTCPVSIIHAHSGGVSSWAACQVAKRHDIPCVVTYHGSEVHTVLARRLKGWRLCRDSFKAADLNLPVSREMMRILMSNVQPTGRSEELLLGVDQSRFFPPGGLSLAPQVLYVGRVEKAKGAYDLLRAWGKVLVHCPAARLVMVGHDRTNGLFLQEARSLGVNESIVLTGPLPGHKVAGIMRESRIFCLPSHSEGTPVSMMEALASGLPVVATKVGGIPDIVEEKMNGILVNKGDVMALAAALVCLLQDSQECIQMGRAAYAFARRHLDSRTNAMRLVQLYEELIGNKSVKRRSAVKKSWLQF